MQQMKSEAIADRGLSNSHSGRAFEELLCAGVVAEDRAFYLLEKSALAAHTLPNSHQTILVHYVTFYLSFACNSNVPEIRYSRST